MYIPICLIINLTFATILDEKPQISSISGFNTKVFSNISSNARAASNNIYFQAVHT